MKLAGSELASFLRKPGKPWVLVYGPDRGLVRERAEILVRAVAEDPRDPFCVVELPAAVVVADPARLGDETRTLVLTGGRRVVRVREASDSVAAVLEPLLADAGASAFVVVEAGDLPPRSSLRRLFEGAGSAAAIPCYADGASDLQALVRGTLAAAGLSAAPEAVTFLVGHLGADREVSRRELEKLVTYMGESREVTLADALACVGDSAAASLDEVVLAAADGDPAALEGALARVLGEGQSPVSIVRAAARHWQRLHLAGGLVEAGDNPRQALGRLRPPVFFMHLDRVAGQLRLWDRAALATALEWITEAELDCKGGAAPPDLVCHRLLLRLAVEARRRRGGRR